MKKCDVVDLKMELIDTICSARNSIDIYSAKKETEIIYKAGYIYASVMDDSKDKYLRSYMDSAMCSYHMVPYLDIVQRLFNIYGMEYAIRCNSEISNSGPMISNSTEKYNYLCNRLNSLFDSINVYIDANAKNSIELGFKMFTSDLQVTKKK